MMNTTIHSILRKAGFPSHFIAGLIGFVLTFAFSPLCAGQGLIPEENFKAGAYLGTIEVIAAFEGLPETKTVSKVKGRSTGDSRMNCIGVPDLGKNLVASGDELPVKLFSLEYSSAVGTFFYTEIINASGSGSGQSLELLDVRKNTVGAEFRAQRLVNGKTLELRVRVKLKRVGA